VISRLQCDGAIFPAIALFVCSLSCASSSEATIRYEVSLGHPEQHLFHVTMTIPDVNGEVEVEIPAWNALYQIRDFSSHIQYVEASAGSAKASTEKVDKQTWRITGRGTITVRYATYWDETGPFATQLNGDHAFINPAMILLYVPERRGEDLSLGLLDVPDAWSVATAARVQIQIVGTAV
jgi:predicted metalloprotease with PDZ domain